MLEKKAYSPNGEPISKVGYILNDLLFILYRGWHQSPTAEWRYFFARSTAFYPFK